MAASKKTEMAPTAKTAEATYVVQRAVTALNEVQGWEDIATVTVPARARRRKVIGLALVQSGVKPEVGGEPLRLRVLDAASAHVTSVSAVAAEPTLEIG